MDWGKLAYAIAPSLVGLGTGLILNNQAVQNARGQANATQEQQLRDLEIAKQNEKNILLAKMANQQTPVKEKSNLPLYIGLGVGGVVILGIVIFAVTRKN
jgi:beta-lactamase class D